MFATFVYFTKNHMIFDKANDDNNVTAIFSV